MIHEYNEEQWRCFRFLCFIFNRGVHVTFVSVLFLVPAGLVILFRRLSAEIISLSAARRADVLPRAFHAA